MNQHYPSQPTPENRPTLPSLNAEFVYDGERIKPDGDPSPPPDCIDCGMDAADPGSSGEACEASRKACGHHCNHSWSHETCCWCARDFSPVAVEFRP